MYTNFTTAADNRGNCILKRPIVQVVKRVFVYYYDTALAYDLLDGPQASIAARYKTHQADGFNPRRLRRNAVIYAMIEVSESKTGVTTR